MRLHHVQVSGPAGCEGAMRAFSVGVLGMIEVAKPALLRSRGGVWFRSGDAEIHVGIEERFTPVRKAHPGIGVSDVELLAASIPTSGAPVRWDDAIVGLRRFHTNDPVGNPVEFQQAR